MISGSESAAVDPRQEQDNGETKAIKPRPRPIHADHYGEIVHDIKLVKGAPRALVLVKRSQLAHRRPRFGVSPSGCATEGRSNARSPRLIVSEIINDVDCCSVRSYLAEQSPIAEFPAF
jgi:hypothetical protein